MDDFILDHTRRATPRSTRMRQIVHRGRSGRRCCASSSTATTPTTCRRGSQALERDLRARRLRLPLPPRASTAAAQAAHLEPARGRARPVDGDEGRRASRSRSSRTPPSRPRSCATTSTASCAIVERHGTTAGVYAHASVGCLHVRPVVNLKTARGRRHVRGASPTTSPTSCSSSAARCRASTATAWCAAPFMRADVRPDALRGVPRRSSARSIPTASSIPGKIVDTPADHREPAVTAPATQTPSPATFFDYSRARRLRPRGRDVQRRRRRAARRSTGTMCPSYMATRDEAHSTRGRANVLRLAMAGRLGEAGLGDEGVHEVLDLCLECRACKAECPVGVDMARFKSEFLADYWERHGTPLARARVRQRAIGRGMGQPPRAALQRDRRQRAGAVAGTKRCSASIAAATLPRLRRRRTLRKQPGAAGADGRRARRRALRRHVHRTTTIPEIGVAGARGARRRRPRRRRWRRTAAAAGRSSRRACSTRRARWPRANVRRAARRCRARRRPSCSVEPSCLSAVREDAPALLRGEAQRRAPRRWPRRAVLFEEYLERELPAGRAHLPLSSGPAAGPAARPLPPEGRWAWPRRRRRCSSRIPGAHGHRPRRRLLRHGRLVRLHARSLRRVAGHRRAEAAARRARARARGRVLVAGGTSCRHQVADFTGVPRYIRPTAHSRCGSG